VSNWHLVIGFGHPYGGEEITCDPDLRIRIPFADRASAERALAEVRLEVQREAAVIPGQVIADVPVITAGEVTG
jgi:hypothetical protein